MCKSNKMYSVIKSNLEEANGIYEDAYYDSAVEIGMDMLYDERYVQEDEVDEWIDSECDLYENFSHCHGDKASYDAADAVIESYSEYLDDDCDCDRDSMREDIFTLLGKSVGF